VAPVIAIRASASCLVSHVTLCPDISKSVSGEH
jgi:hypothetical protein